jgi:ABC-type histidine transport system ATPase subunit
VIAVLVVISAEAQVMRTAAMTRGALFVMLATAAPILLRVAAERFEVRERAAERAGKYLSLRDRSKPADRTRRVCPVQHMAGILTLEPEVLVLDEPTTFPGMPGQRALADLLCKLEQAKIPIMHNTQFALTVCARAVFHRNNVVADEVTVREIADRFSWEFSAG